jgi:hypothetical protein
MRWRLGRTSWKLTIGTKKWAAQFTGPPFSIPKLVCPFYFIETEPPVPAKDSKCRNRGGTKGRVGRHNLQKMLTLNWIQPGKWVQDKAFLGQNQQLLFHKT